MSIYARPFLVWAYVDGKDTRNMAPKSKKSSDALLIVELQQGLDLSSVGAKSANLGKAMEHGFRVPPG